MDPWDDPMMEDVDYMNNLLDDMEEEFNHPPPPEPDAVQQVCFAPLFKILFLILLYLCHVLISFDTYSNLHP